MIIREMQFDDISPVAELERACSLTPWSENGLLTYMMREDVLFLVAADEFPEDFNQAGADSENGTCAEMLSERGETAIAEGENDTCAEMLSERTELAMDDEEDFFWPEVYGYVGLLMVPYEADVLNITVREKVRNRGIGTRLLEEAFARAKAYGVTDIHLEVRESNAAAIHVYEKMGFSRDGIRRNYYTDPVENAVTMTLRQKL